MDNRTASMDKRIVSMDKLIVFNGWPYCIDKRLDCIHMDDAIVCMDGRVVYMDLTGQKTISSQLVDNPF